jgi:hypothetical protein
MAFLQLCFHHTCSGLNHRQKVQKENTVDSFGIFGNILDYLGPFGTIWNHLGPFGTIWNHLEPFGTIVY